MAEKLYAGCRGLTAKSFVLVDKIQKFSCEIYNLPIFSLGCIKSGWGVPPNLVPAFNPFIADERSAICLSICRAVSKL